MQRLKTRPQFQAALKGETVARTAHFALHRVALGAQVRAQSGVPLPVQPEMQAGEALAAGPAAEASGGMAAPAAVAVVAAGHGGVATAPVRRALVPPPLFSVADVWLGAMVPKRWARRAVTRNAIKRQIYTVGVTFEAQLVQAAHVVRLRSAFDRKQFVSATSDQLKQAVRAELLQLFGYATRHAGAAVAPPVSLPAPPVAEPVTAP